MSVGLRKRELKAREVDLEHSTAGTQYGWCSVRLVHAFKLTSAGIPSLEATAFDAGSLWIGYSRCDLKSWVRPELAGCTGSADAVHVVVKTCAEVDCIVKGRTEASPSVVFVCGSGGVIWGAVNYGTRRKAADSPQDFIACQRAPRLSFMAPGLRRRLSGKGSVSTNQSCEQACRMPDRESCLEDACVLYSCLTCMPLHVL